MAQAGVKMTTGGGESGISSSGGVAASKIIEIITAMTKRISGS